MCADPEVMRYFVSPIEPADSIAWARARNDEIVANGWGLWAVEVLEGPEFIGFVGIWNNPTLQAVEVGWRLDHPYWGHGYATEAAAASLAYGFTEVGLAEIQSCTATPNEPSRAVMRRIGMTHDVSRDFEHPRVPDGNWLKPHVLYAITAEQWQAQTARSAPVYDL
jgi:ribosomal-protein-alanine N-acetyltransferase